jgi:hypothetical protein
LPPSITSPSHRTAAMASSTSSNAEATRSTGSAGAAAHSRRGGKSC